MHRFLFETILAFPDPGSGSTGPTESRSRSVWNRIHANHCFGSGILGWLPIRIQGFDDQKLFKKLQPTKILFFFFKKCNLLIHRPSKLHEKPSVLNREHPALQNMGFLNFFLFSWASLPYWIWIRIPTLLWLNPDPIAANTWKGHSLYTSKWSGSCSETDMILALCRWNEPALTSCIRLATFLLSENYKLNIIKEKKTVPGSSCE